jgi:cyanophycinase
MNHLISISDLQKKDYIVVLPMSSEEPDSAYIYFKKQVEKLTPNPIVMLNFNKQTATNQILVDSLQKQNLFLLVVRPKSVYGSV